MFDFYYIKCYYWFNNSVCWVFIPAIDLVPLAGAYIAAHKSPIFGGCVPKEDNANFENFKIDRFCLNHIVILGVIWTYFELVLLVTLIAVLFDKILYKHKSKDGIVSQITSTNLPRTYIPLTYSVHVHVP